MTPVRKMAMVALATAATQALSHGALAQQPSFEGKTVRIVVGFAPGGGYDSYARLLSRHLGERLPGKPAVVVENMPGAGSLTSVRWLDGPAPKDGTVIVAFNPGLITQALLEPDKVGRISFLNYAWIGNMARDQRVCYLWRASSKGVKTFDEFRKTKGWIFGTTGVGVSNWVNFRTLQKLFDVDMKIILGFRGSGEQRIAVERGEVDGDCGSWTSISEDWVKNDRILPVLKLSEKLPKGAPTDVPYARDLLTSEEDRAVLDVINGAGEIGRPFIASRQVPAPAVAALRKAFDEALASGAAEAEADKMRLPLDPMSSTEVEQALKQIYGAPAGAVTRARALLSE